MTDDLVEAMKSSESFADVAKFNYDKIKEVKQDIQGQFLNLAFLLVQSRDYRLWEFLNFESFESFLGDPAIALKRSTAYNLMRLYDTFVVKFKVPNDDISKIDRTKLLKICPVIEKLPEHVHEWIDKARELSVSDLNIEVNEALAGKDVPHTPLPSSPSPPGPLDSACCVCGKGPVDRHHFPVGRSSSSNEIGDWTLPLCRECHSSYHQEPKEWLWTYKKNWARYLFKKINDVR